MTLQNGKNSRHRNFWRFAISLIGLGMILMALNETALYFLGDSTPAVVAARRVGRSYSGGTKVGQQYKWSVSWTYSVDGREYSGSTTLRGSATRSNYGNTVYYYPFAPQISSLTAGRTAGLGSLITAGAGVLLIFVINKPHKKKAASAKGRFQGKTEQQVLDEMTDYDDSLEEFYDEPSKKS